MVPSPPFFYLYIYVNDPRCTGKPASESGGPKAAKDTGSSVNLNLPKAPPPSSADLRRTSVESGAPPGKEATAESVVAPLRPHTGIYYIYIYCY